MENYKAIVVGAGPVGVALALALSRVDENQPILLLDAAAALPKYSPEKPDARIFALNEGARSLLDQLGVWSDIQSQRCLPYSRMQVWDAQGTGSIEFDCVDSGADFDTRSLGHIVEANLIQEVLTKAIDNQPNIRLAHPEKVSDLDLTDNQAILGLESGQRVQAELVCAADGANSSLRQMAGIQVNEEHTGQEAIVANVWHELPNECCAWQIFMPTGPLAFLPMADFEGRHLSSIVWSLDQEDAERLKQSSDQEFEFALTRAIEERFGQVSLMSKRFSFSLVQRHAQTYVQPSFALVGDAAHSIHPLAGLGANIGFQDVAALTEELARATSRSIPWGNLQILKRYQRARQFDNELVLKSMKGFKDLFGQTNPAIAAIRNLGLQGANVTPAIKRRFIQQATMSR